MFMRTKVATLDPMDTTFTPSKVSTSAEKCVLTTIDAKIMPTLSQVVPALLLMMNMKIIPSIMSSMVAKKLTRSAAMATLILMIFEKITTLSSSSFI